MNADSEVVSQLLLLPLYKFTYFFGCITTSFLIFEGGGTVWSKITEMPICLEKQASLSFSSCVAM